jgi:hypothetical protein
MLLDHANKFNTRILIETGTFLWDMVFAIKDQFNEIYSIELSQDLHDRARSVLKRYPHIHLVAADSATAHESVPGGIKERWLFWLCGHYSGGITALGDVRCRFGLRLKLFSGIRSRTRPFSLTMPFVSTEVTDIQLCSNSTISL